MNPHYNMRVGTNALIVRDQQLLLVAFDDASGFRYNLPGGGVKEGENIPQALEREVREETTAEVIVGQLAYTFEYFPPAYANQYGPLRKLTLLFHCTLQAGSEPRLPAEPDPNQVGVEWLPLEQLPSAPLLPELGSHWLHLTSTTPVENRFNSKKLLV